MLPGSADVPIEVLVLRTPGAGSAYIDAVIDLLAREIDACTCAPVRVTVAVGRPGDLLPYRHDVLAHLDPLDGVLDVAVTFTACCDSYRFRTDCTDDADVRAIGRAIGAHVDATRRRVGPSPRGAPMVR